LRLAELGHDHEIIKSIAVNITAGHEPAAGVVHIIKSA
jgi:hypothetical protein